MKIKNMRHAFAVAETEAQRPMHLPEVREVFQNIADAIWEHYRPLPDTDPKTETREDKSHEPDLATPRR